MIKNVLFITRDAALTEIVKYLLKDLRHNVSLFGTIQYALDSIYTSMPNLLIIDIMENDPKTISSLNTLKEDPIFKQLPVLAIFPDTFIIPDWNAIFVEDYIRKSALEKELNERVRLTILRSERIVEINPLTRLPGNISITRQVQERLDKAEGFALCYADIDHFKPFNDKYGFLRGDEVLRIAGRLIMNIVKNKQPNDSFVGHIGGDDFVFIMNPELVEEAVHEIIKAFDSIIPTLYNQEEREKGYISGLDRQGRESQFPIVRLSIGITDTLSRKFEHFGEVTEAASEMKCFAKLSETCRYRWDKRHPDNEPPPEGDLTLA
jgi:diguanylate cyclase (GGDEF)-like protein